MATSFSYDIDRRIAPLLRLLGLRRTDGVTVTDDGTLVATFGRFRVQTPVSNIADITRTGPYNLLKVAGVRLSMADRGLTFGTNNRRGACITFHRPVDRVIVVPHPGLTVTVDDPDSLKAAIFRAQQ